MSTTNRLNVVPTVTVLAVVKNRLSGAQKGYKLLKKKADALTMRYRQILAKIVAAKREMGTAMRASAFALTEAKYVAGEGIKHTVLDGVDRANVRVRAKTDNVAGVKLPRFEHHLEGADGGRADMTGLGGGGKQLQNCKRAYLGAVKLLVELASLQTAFITLDLAIKTTNRRVNALKTSSRRGWKTPSRTSRVSSTSWSARSSSASKKSRRRRRRTSRRAKKRRRRRSRRWRRAWRGWRRGSGTSSTPSGAPDARGGGRRGNPRICSSGSETRTSSSDGI